MAVRRRRRKRVTWFPTNATPVNRIGQDAFEATPFTIAFNFSETIDISHVITPLIPQDVPTEPADNSTLADIVGNEYVTERIVGNVYGHAYQGAAGATTGTIPGIILCTGIFVARADGDTPDEPVGGGLAALSVDDSSRNYNPLDNATQREPWMFRRTWRLSTMLPIAEPINLQSFEKTAQQAGRQYPQSTAGYHGLRTGPFIDVKSKRRVGQDDRLYLVTAAMAIPTVSDPSVANYNVSVTYDLRILGALRKARGRSAF